MPIRSTRLFVAFIMLSACTVERIPHLYPANNAADMTGVLEGHIIGHRKFRLHRFWKRLRNRLWVAWADIWWENDQSVCISSRGSRGRFALRA
jgi:hypothetical protein